MPDGRKKNGGYRENAGRKPRAEEIEMIEKMDAAKAPVEAWQKLAEKVEEGNVQAIRTWLAYRYGKPRERVDVTTEGEALTGFRVVRDDDD